MPTRRCAFSGRWCPRWCTATHTLLCIATSSPKIFFWTKRKSKSKLGTLGSAGHSTPDRRLRRRAARCSTPPPRSSKACATRDPRLMFGVLASFCMSWCRGSCHLTRRTTTNSRSSLLKATTASPSLLIRIGRSSSWCRTCSCWIPAAGRSWRTSWRPQAAPNQHLRCSPTPRPPLQGSSRALASAARRQTPAMCAARTRTTTRLGGRPPTRQCRTAKRWPSLHRLSPSLQPCQRPPLCTRKTTNHLPHPRSTSTKSRQSPACPCHIQTLTHHRCCTSLPPSRAPSLRPRVTTRAAATPWTSSRPTKRPCF
mmetsp:Transcript_7421/g.18730  ORF Transcript_7421/g.18730 Transcript_7421/m.18730 type:complete len:311 (-) Transcript_7421:1119-2051(-)